MKYTLNVVHRRFAFREGELFASCHASTLVRTGDGRTLMACFGGTREGSDDVKIWAGFPEEGRFTRICADEDLPHWNPVLYRQNGKILLFFKAGRTISEWKTMLCESEDEGESWSAPRELVPGDESGGRGPVKNKPLLLSDGTLLAPSSFERNGKWWVQPDHFENGCWTLLDPCELPPAEEPTVPDGVIQPSFWEYPKGHVHMLMRSTRRVIYRGDSADCGRSFGTLYPTVLPSNNSGIDLVSLDDEGSIVVAFNPVPEVHKPGGKLGFGPRTPLKLYVSEDNGETFRDALTLESAQGEYSYPAVIREGNRLFVSYTWNRRNIVCAEIAVEKNR